MIIRAAVPSDAAEIERLFLEFVTYLRSIGDTNDYKFSAQQYLDDGFGHHPAFRGIVADDSPGLAGYALFCNMYDGDYLRNLYLVDLYVSEAQRGRGIGRMLVDGVRSVAVEEGITRLSWAVHKNNTGALHFYESIGAVYCKDTHVMYLDL